MNLEQVAYFVEHPRELTLADAPELRSLTEKHPYASVYSLLYLTALANGKSVDLDSALQQYAYRLTDRTKLYYLLHPTNDHPVETSNPIQQPEIITAVPEPIIEKQTPVPAIIEQPETVEELIVANETIPEVVVSPVEEAEIPPSEEAFAEPLEDVTFEFVTEAFTREQHFELKPEQSEKQDESEKQSGNEEENEREEKSLSITPIEPDSKRSFTSWLKVNQPELKNEKQSGNEKQDESELPSPKGKVDDIIESFIKEEPSITRGKAEFYSPSKKAKESLDEDTLPVSETLAKIYAAQGNYPKAIHVYHQLMLSYPEKKSLFAVQIDALKKKLTP